MHVKNDIKSMLAAPSDHIVKSLEAVLICCETHVVLIGEKLVMERNADGICTGRSDEFDILLSHIIILEHLPELGSEVGTDHLPEHLVYHPRRICLLEAEHISFRIEPVAEVGTLDE